MILCIDSDSSEVLHYVERVKKNAEKRNKRISDSIDNIMSQKKGYKKKLITTTGSDGRLENKSHEGIKSNMEFIIIEDPQLESLSTTPRTSDDLIQVVSRNVSFLIDHIEKKQIGIDRLTCFQNDSNLVFPTRIWDSLPIWGNQELYSRLRLMVSDEIINNPKLSQYFQKRLAVHKRAVKNGKSNFRDKESILFDLDAGIINYDPENMNEGVKYGPLRVIQYSLALALMRKIRNIGAHPDFVEFLPPNILDRLDFIIDNEFTALSKVEIEHIKYIYGYFLKIYHQLQYENAFLEKTQFHLCKDDAKDMKEMLNYLTESFSVEKLLKI